MGHSVGSLDKHEFRADGMSDCRARRAEGAASRSSGPGTQFDGFPQPLPRHTGFHGFGPATVEDQSVAGVGRSASRC